MTGSQFWTSSAQRAKTDVTNLSHQPAASRLLSGSRSRLSYAGAPALLRLRTTAGAPPPPRASA